MCACVCSLGRTLDRSSVTPSKRGKFLRKAETSLKEECSLLGPLKNLLPRYALHFSHINLYLYCPTYLGCLCEIHPLFFSIVSCDSISLTFYKYLYIPSFSNFFFFSLLLSLLISIYFSYPFPFQLAYRNIIANSRGRGIRLLHHC